MTKDPKKEKDNRPEWEKTWLPTQIPDDKELSSSDKEEPDEVVGAYIDVSGYCDNSCEIIWCEPTCPSCGADKGKCEWDCKLMWK